MSIADWSLWCFNPLHFLFFLSESLEFSCISACLSLNFTITWLVLFALPLLSSSLLLSIPANISLLPSLSLFYPIPTFFYVFFFFLPSCLPPGDAFPWTVSLSQFSVYTLLGQQRSLSLLEPMGCTSTLAVTSHKLQSCSEGRHSFVVCLHVDLQPIHVKCSNPQVSQTVLKSHKVVIRFTCIFTQIIPL